MAADDLERKVARKMDRYFGFGDPEKTLAWCRLLLHGLTGEEE